jgi:hypothetical protein
MDNSILVWAVVGLVTILLIVALVFSFKVWKVMHILSLLFVYGAAIAVCTYAAISLKTNAAWKQKVSEMRTRLEAAEKEKQELQYGKDLITFAEVEDSHLVLPAKLWQTTYDQGMLLRGCTPGSFDGTVVTLNTAAAVPAPADGSAPPPPPPNGLSPKMIVYAFQELELPDMPGKMVPVIFLGEWKVTAATATSATLTPSLPLDALQRSAVGSGGRTWALYGRLPRDNHYAFVNHDAVNPVEAARDALHDAEQELAQANLADDQGKVSAAQAKVDNARKALDELRASARPLFGQPYTVAEIAALPGVPPKARFSAILPGVPANEIDAIYNRFLERLAYDGLPVQDIPAAKSIDVDNHLYQKIKFKLADGAPFPVEVDVAAAERPFVNKEDKELFDPQGRARSDFLRQGGPTQFTNEYDAKQRRDKYGQWAVDDVGVFDQETAGQFVSSGTAEKLDDEFYVRPLRDYEFIFHEFNRQDTQFDAQNADVIASTKRISDATALAQSESNLLQEKKTKLESDYNRFSTDLDTIAAERAALEAAQAQQMNELRQLFTAINQQLAELNQLHVMMAEEARRRAELASTGGE